jgi:hypothetical protein
VASIWLVWGDWEYDAEVVVEERDCRAVRDLLRGRPRDCVYETMGKMFCGFSEEAMMVVTPAEEARRAATILVDIPPVPREEPAEETGVC